MVPKRSTVRATAACDLRPRSVTSAARERHRRPARRASCSPADRAGRGSSRPAAGADEQPRPSPRRAPRRHRSPVPRSPRCAWRRVIASARAKASRARRRKPARPRACTGRPRDVRVAAMHLDLRGHPLHTRSLSVTLTRRADGRLDVRGELVDLRKRGFVPVAGELQPSGVVHHMLLDAIVDPATRRLDDIVARQPRGGLRAVRDDARRELPRSRGSHRARSPATRLDDGVRPAARRGDRRPARLLARPHAGAPARPRRSPGCSSATAHRAPGIARRSACSAAT